MGKGRALITCDEQILLQECIGDYGGRPKLPMQVGVVFTEKSAECEVAGCEDVPL